MYSFYIFDANFLYSEAMALILFQGVAVFLRQEKVTLRCYIVWRKYKKCLRKAALKKKSYVSTSVIVLKAWIIFMYTVSRLMSMNRKQKVHCLREKQCF